MAQTKRLGYCHGGKPFQIYDKNKMPKMCPRVPKYVSKDVIRFLTLHWCVISLMILIFQVCYIMVLLSTQCLYDVNVMWN